MKQDTWRDTAPAGRLPCIAPGDPAESNAPAVHGLGWYLYGMIRDRHSGDAELVIGPGLDGRCSVEVLPCGDIAAVVSRVEVAEFGPAALRARLRDEVWLEAAVRGHDRVVGAVHGQRTVLPTRFGCVYASIRDLAAALAGAHDCLLAQLERLDGCDEWGVRLYVDAQTMRETVAAENSAVRSTRRELATARPGRAFFLRRKLSDTVAAETARAVAHLARAAYDRLARRAVSGRLDAQRRGSRDPDEEIEVLRAAFLVRSAEVHAFLEDFHRLVEGQRGLRGDFSGPWPPYSFAALGEGAPR